MTKGTLIFLFGIILVVLPYLGIPTSYKMIISITLGVFLILLGYALRRGEYLATLDDENDMRTSDTFVETTEQLFS